MEYTEEELSRFLTLRALEWISFPEFIGIGIGQIGLLFQTPLIVFSELAALNFFWYFVCQRLINIRVALLGIWVNNLKWITSPGVALWFYRQGKILLAVLALLWPVLVLPVLSIPNIIRMKIAGRFVGLIEEAFFRQMADKGKGQVG